MKTITSIAQENSPEFNAWFADSKVTQWDAAPLVAYHGSDAIDQFDEFNSDGLGIWFSEEKSTAENYLGKDEDGIPRIYEVYIQAAKPLHISSEIDILDDHLVTDALQLINADNGTSFTPEQLGFSADYVGTTAIFTSMNEKFIACVAAQGFDSLRAFEQGAVTWGVLSPAQVKIKSVLNLLES